MSRQNLMTPPELLTSPHVAHAVIGAWLNGSPASGVPFLKPEHFTDDRDKVLWAAALDLEAQGVKGDYVALVERVRRSATIEYSDWATYCSSILETARLSSNLSIQAHARTVYENWRRWQAYREGMRQAGRALNLSIPLPPDDEETSEARKQWSVAEILQAQFAEPRGPWPGIIPVGLTVIGARPKYGKSLLMLQVSAALGSGGMLFGQRVEQAPVLYYALEDSIKRIKERLSRLNIPSTAKIDFAREITPLHTGGLAEVEAAARDHSLIVLDTISRAVPGQDFNREAALFGDLLGRLQTVALQREMSIVTVVHTRKPNGMEHDPIDDVLGSTQMTAAADCVLAIYREEGRTLLKGRARDMDDIDLAMEFDRATICWQLLGEAEQVRQTENEEEILEALRELGRTKVTDLAKLLGKDRSNTSRRLRRLWTQGKCKRDMVDKEAFYYLGSGEEEEE